MKLKNEGWVRSERKGPTGVGKTLETYIGITENNLMTPDLGNIELKAHREDTQNLITLFTFNRGAWIMNPLEAVKKYGTVDKDPKKGGRLGLYLPCLLLKTVLDYFFIWMANTSMLDI